MEKSSCLQSLQNTSSRLGNFQTLNKVNVILIERDDSIKAQTNNRSSERDIIPKLFQTIWADFYDLKLLLPSKLGVAFVLYHVLFRSPVTVSGKVQGLPEQEVSIKQ